MKDPFPNKFLLHFFKWFCDPDLHPFIEGDLYELYRERARALGRKKASRRFALDVLLLFRPGIVRNPSFRFLENLSDMHKLNFILSWRNLIKNRVFSIINIGGLALGMTVALLIGLWVRDELSYDRFHENADRIYKVIANRDFGDNIFTDHNMTFPYARVVAEEIPEVEYSVWTTHRQSSLLSREEKAIKQSGYAVGGPYFQMFSWKFLQGDAEQALSEPASIVLTESSAQVFFGDEDPMGRSLTLNNSKEVTVSGVLQDPPTNSSLSFDYIRPFNYSDPNTQRWVDHWHNYNWDVYVQTLPGTDVKQLNRDLTAIMVKHTESEISDYFAFPMAKWRLYSEFTDGINTGGAIRYVRLFGIIAVIILIIACINFMNLSTARAQKRSMEVAVRKTLGSGKSALIQQFLTESTVVAFLAFFGAMIAVTLLLPYFNQLVGRSLYFNLLDPFWWSAALGLILFVGLLAGSYPAFHLSSFLPVKVLSGETERPSKTITPRRFLVVFQFVAAIALISATILVFQQIQFIKNRDIGYDPNNLIMVPTTGTINDNFAAIKNDLQQSGLVKAATRSNSPITAIWSRSHAPDWPGRPAGPDVLISKLYVDADYLETMDVQLTEGRDFTGGPADRQAVLLNQAAVEAMGLKEPVGRQLIDGEDKLHVLGVIDDVVMESPFAAVEPLMAHYSDRHFSYASIRLKEGVQPQMALGEIERIFKRHNPAYPFEYEFVDEVFGQKFSNEMLVRKVINIFAGLAIFISCLGLIGLVAYIIEKRRKEIAIRKVLGASQQHLLLLVGKEFLLLVIIALFIATPITYFGVEAWLHNYDYQVGVNWWVFLIVGALLLLLTLLIVGVQTLRAAWSNPIHAIRLER